MRLKMEQGSRKRTAEFNWTNNKDASSVGGRISPSCRSGDAGFRYFRRARKPTAEYAQTDGAIRRLLKRNGLSDPQQLLPLLKEISTDEHLPLIARNHALRLIKKIEK